MKLLSSRLRIGGLIAVAIMGITAAALPLSVSWVNDARQERDAVDQRLGSLKDVLELLVDAETGERGYVITGREAFLQPYHMALTALPAQFELLQQRYADVPTETRQLVNELTGAAQRRLAGLSEIVQQRQAGGFVAAEPLVSSGHGKAEMDRVRALAGQVAEIEAKEQVSLNAALEQKIRRSIAISLLSTALNLLLLGYLARMLVRAVRAGQSAAQQAQDTSRQLAQGMDALKRRNEEVSTLGEMSRLLQAEMTIAEALDVTSLFASHLLPQTAGAVYLLQPATQLLEQSSRWGDAATLPLAIEPSDCWGIRRDQLHRNHRPGDLRCAHCGAPDLTQYAEHHTCVPLTAYGEQMGLLYVRGDEHTHPETTADMARAISEQMALALSNARLREVLRDQSIRDPLTGWFNRRHMEDTLAREIARAQRSRTPLSIVVADIDHFKKINDMHGHPAGDAVLRAATRHMAAQIRTSDVACRFGGEEFVLILPDCTKEGAMAKAQAQCDSLRALRIREGATTIAVTASFGVATAPEDGADATALFHAADAAVYAAKRGGRDRVVAAAEAHPPAPGT